VTKNGGTFTLPRAPLGRIVNDLCLLPDTQTGGGSTPYNGLYGKAPPETGTFFTLQVYKRVGLGLAEVYEREGNLIKIFRVDAPNVGIILIH